MSEVKLDPYTLRWVAGHLREHATTLTDFAGRRAVELVAHMMLQRSREADQPAPTETAPACHGDYVYIPRAEYERTMERLRLAEPAPQGADRYTREDHEAHQKVMAALQAPQGALNLQAIIDVKVNTGEPRGAIIREARASARLDGDTIPLETQGAPPWWTEINGHKFLSDQYAVFSHTNCDKCGLQFGARFTRTCEVE